MSATAGAKLAYQYVVLRCVPRVDREEFVNVGVVVYCQATDFLEVAWQVDRERLRAFDPSLDLDQVCEALEFVAGVCAGDERAGAARAADLVRRQRQRVGVERGEINVESSRRLHGVHVHGKAMLARQRRRRGDRLDYARLVVGEHQTEERTLARIGESGRLHIDDAVG